MGMGPYMVDCMGMGPYGVYVSPYMEWIMVHTHDDISVVGAIGQKS